MNEDEQNEQKRIFAIILLFNGIVFLVDELWMLGLPIGHILPDLSKFHIAPFGFQYHHWMTGIILVTLSLCVLHHDNVKKRITKGAVVELKLDNE